MFKEIPNFKFYSLHDDDDDDDVACYRLLTDELLKFSNLLRIFLVVSN